MGADRNGMNCSRLLAARQSMQTFSSFVVARSFGTWTRMVGYDNAEHSPRYWTTQLELRTIKYLICGAPGEIRTPDPLVRSRKDDFIGS